MVGLRFHPRLWDKHCGWYEPADVNLRPHRREQRHCLDPRSHLLSILGPAPTPHSQASCSLYLSPPLPSAPCHSLFPRGTLLTPELDHSLPQHKALGWFHITQTKSQGLYNGFLFDFNSSHLPLFQPQGLCTTIPWLGIFYPQIS